MGEYVFNSKNRYHLPSKSPVNLLEYMMFEHKSDGHKCIVLKLRNQTIHDIRHIKFQIKQFNDVGDAIHVANYALDDLALSAYNKDFTPATKIKVSRACELIEFSLLQAESTNSRWERGSWSATRGANFPTTDSNTNHDTPVGQNQMTFPYPVVFTMLFMYILIVVGVFVLINAQ